MKTITLLALLITAGCASPSKVPPSEIDHAAELKQHILLIFPMDIDVHLKLTLVLVFTGIGSFTIMN